MISFVEWLKNISDDSINESSSRYSIEINFRSKIREVLENYAKICLGYVSAALKASEFHVKQVFDDGVIRILVSSRNWDDGEWVVIVSWNPHHNSFYIAKGFFNKLHKNVSIKKGTEEKCTSDNASEIAVKVKSLMHHLKGQKDNHIEKLKKVPLKTGPKKRV